MVGCPADHDAVQARSRLLVLQRCRRLMAVLHDAVQAERELWEIPLQGPDPLSSATEC